MFSGLTNHLDRLDEIGILFMFMMQSSQRGNAEVVRAAEEDTQWVRFPGGRQATTLGKCITRAGWSNSLAQFLIMPDQRHQVV